MSIWVVVEAAGSAAEVQARLRDALRPIVE